MPLDSTEGFYLAGGQHAVSVTEAIQVSNNASNGDQNELNDESVKKERAYSSYAYKLSREYRKARGNFPWHALQQLLLLLVALVIMTIRGAAALDAKIAFTILGGIGAAVSIVGVFRLLYVIYSKSKAASASKMRISGNTAPPEDPSKYITVMRTFDVYVAYVLAVCWIFMLFWVWDPKEPIRDSFWQPAPTDASNGPWVAAARFLLAGIAVSTAVGFSRYMPVDPFLEVVVSIVAFTSLSLAALLLGVAFGITRRNIERRIRHSIRRHYRDQGDAEPSSSSLQSKADVMYVAAPMPDQISSTHARHRNSSRQQQHTNPGHKTRKEYLSLEETAYGSLLYNNEENV